MPREEPVLALTAEFEVCMCGEARGAARPALFLVGIDG